MTRITKRLLIGLIGLLVFWCTGMISAVELGKSTILMAGAMLGIVGLFMLGRPKIRLISAFSLLVYFLFFLDAAVKGFLRDYFGLRPNFYVVLEAIMNTDAGETREFFLHNWVGLTQTLAIFIVISASAFLLERRLARSEKNALQTASGRRVMSVVIAAFGIFIAIHFNPSMARENPLLSWPMRYQHYQHQLSELNEIRAEMANNMEDKSEWKVSYHGQDKRTVVLVIGDSINRFNMSLYGYPRKTTPLLDELRNELIVFSDVVSPDATTLESMRKMLTPADIDKPELWKQKPDVLMLAEEAGYKTFWLSNQFVGDGWIALTANQADKLIFINKGYGRGENNLDGNLLPHFDQALADPSPKKLIVVHLLGAHPTYDMRYPEQFAKFDDLNDGVIDSMKRTGRSMWTQYMRNKYDNAILYNDYVIGNLIKRLAISSPDQSALLVYSSDHAQEVGHTRDHAGHSSDDDSGYEIPMVVWQNEKTALKPKERARLEQMPYQTDSLDHTMLGMLNIDSTYYDPSQDIMNKQFNQKPRYINGSSYQPNTTD